VPPWLCAKTQWLCANDSVPLCLQETREFLVS
jgi:hypothetical protein